jgi:hypothetical protein
MRTLEALLKKDDKTWAEVVLVQAVATLSTLGEFARKTPEEVFDVLVAYAFPVPETIFFFRNGQTMAGDIQGKQMPRYQGKHAEALARLAEDGIDLSRVRNVYGSPENPVDWPRPELIREAHERAGEPPGEAPGGSPGTPILDAYLAYRDGVYALSEGVHGLRPDVAAEADVAKARIAGVCRVCGGAIPGGPGRPPGWQTGYGSLSFPPPAVTLNFGDEFAHTACLTLDPVDVDRGFFPGHTPETAGPDPEQEAGPGPDSDRTIGGH